MTYTNFPGGVTSQGVPLMGSGQIPTTTGSYFFVNSGTGSNSNDGRSPTTALATIDYAIGLCTANMGDVIVVMPGHAESISSAAAINADVAGISIIGLGNGNNRPTISIANTGAFLQVSAANVSMSNLRVTATVDEVVKCILVGAARCTLDNIEYFETASAQAIQFLLTNASADYLTVRNCYHYQASAAAAAQLWIQLVGCDNVRILDNTFILALQNGATCAVINATTAVVNCQIARNTILQTGGTTQVSAILLVAASTGFVHDNRVAAAVTTLAGIIALASAYGSQNYASHTVNKSGILDPVADV